MNEIVYLNGEMLPVEEAKISVLDYGFLYGYGVFETMRAYNGHVFLLDRHIGRLHGSLEKLGIKPEGLSFEKAVTDTVKANKLIDARVRLAVTIGEGGMVPDPASCEKPTVLVIATEYKSYTKSVYEKGFSTITSAIRRNSQSPLSRLKSANYLESMLAKQEAREAGVDEAIFLNDKGFVAEASMSNLFLFSSGALKTPGRESGILPGITREVVLELADGAGIDTIVCDIAPGELTGAREAFLTNSLMEIMPLVKVSGRAIGSGSPGPVTRGLMAAYRELVMSMTSQL
ncbi:aminotransferase class IV [Chloroflexota bacterium]